jgi:hypothetical protein
MRTELVVTLKRLGAGFLHMLFGSVLCSVLTLSLAPFITNDYVQLIAVLFTFFIFYSLIFTGGYRDGLKDSKRAKIHSEFKYPKYRWFKIGLLLFGMMAGLCFLLFLDKLFWGSEGFFVFYRLFCSVTYPLLLFLEMTELSLLPSYMPFILIAYFLPIPFSAEFGYKMGFLGKLENQAYKYK